MIVPLTGPEYEQKICRYIMDIDSRHSKSVGDEYLSNIDTIKQYLHDRLFSLGDLNILMHLHYTLLTDLDIISRSIKCIGLYATKELFDICKCSELRTARNRWIINISLYNIIMLLTMEPIKYDNDLYKGLVNFVCEYVPKELYEMLDLSKIKSNGRIKLKNSLDPTFETNVDVLFVDDMRSINSLINALKTSHNVSNTAISKIVSMTTRIKVNDDLVHRIMSIGNKSLNITYGNDAQCLYMTMNLSDYKNMFKNWHMYSVDGNKIIPLMYYCLLNEHDLFDIIKIEDKNIENDLITYLQSDPS